VLDSTLMRRTLIFVLALGLAGWGSEFASASISAFCCLADSGTPDTKAPCCDGMNIYANDAQIIAAQNLSCCFVSGAPLPESQFKGSDSSCTTAAAAVPDPIDEPPRVCVKQCVIQVRDVPPPAFQSLLCTFLI
jgi:hypothetical protein